MEKKVFTNELGNKTEIKVAIIKGTIAVFKSLRV